MLCVSCTTLPESIGKKNEIIVITSPEDKDLIEIQITGLFSHIIYTPQPELEFSINFKNPWDLERLKEYSNIIITSLDFPEDSTGDVLMKKIISNNNQKSPLFVLKDLYAKNQIICVIHTLDPIFMENEVKSNKEWILNEFRSTLVERMKQDLFKHGKNISLSDKVQDMYGYTLDLQNDYKIIKSDPSKAFIWLGRGFPYRWITMHKIKKDRFTGSSKKAWAELINIYDDTIPRIHIGENYRNTEKIEYDNKNRRIMRGIYEHDESESGGPFLVYIFDTEIENEVILVSGFVNYPGHEKLLLLKQLEVIAFSIH